MDFFRLRKSDGSWRELQDDWQAQFESLDDDLTNYASSSMTAIERLADGNNNEEWAVGLKSKDRFMAVAIVIRANQKGFVGPVLRIREVTVCPNLDYGVLSENDYIDTLVGILNAAVNLSETHLRAKHIKMHLRSPSDAVFFRVVGKSLDSKGVFEATDAHGAWLSFTKFSPLQGV